MRFLSNSYLFLNPAYFLCEKLMNFMGMSILYLKTSNSFEVYAPIIPRFPYPSSIEGVIIDFFKSILFLVKSASFFMSKSV
jgi:hypothetical protein